MAFFWAFVFGGLLAPVAYYRLERSELGEDPRWHAVARLWFERLEWATYDWRARELGAASERVDDVVLVTVDEETMVNARESERPEWAMRPWPRELMGQLVDQALKEGAALVVMDESLADVSPHRYTQGRGENRKGDDELLADYLAKNEGKVIIGFDWSTRPRRLPDRALMPFLVRVAETDAAGALPVVQQVLSRQLPAWVEESGEQRFVWAGASSEAKAKELAAALDVKGTPTSPLAHAGGRPVGSRPRVAGGAAGRGGRVRGRAADGRAAARRVAGRAGAAAAVEGRGAGSDDGDARRGSRAARGAALRLGGAARRAADRAGLHGDRSGDAAGRHPRGVRGQRPGVRREVPRADRRAGVPHAALLGRRGERAAGGAP